MSAIDIKVHYYGALLDKPREECSGLDLSLSSFISLSTGLEIKIVQYWILTVYLNLHLDSKSLLLGCLQNQHARTHTQNFRFCKRSNSAQILLLMALFSCHPSLSYSLWLVKWPILSETRISIIWIRRLFHSLDHQYKIQKSTAISLSEEIFFSSASIIFKSCTRGMLSLASSNPTLPLQSFFLDQIEIGCTYWKIDTQMPNHAGIVITHPGKEFHDAVIRRHHVNSKVAMQTW